MSSDSCSSRTTSSSDHDFRVKPRHLEPRVLYTDYDVAFQKKLIASAKEVVRTVAEKGVVSEDAFFKEVATQMKDGLGAQDGFKWHVIAGNDFGLCGEALKGTISFFAVGDVKLLVYRSQSK